MKNKLNLRDGFTTGSAATAATMAAFNLLLNNIKNYEMSIPLPPFFYKNIALNGAEDYLELNPYDNNFFQPHDYNTICTKSIISKKSLKIPILRIDDCLNNTVEAEVEKDGGDDPDVTKHAHIISTVRLIRTNSCATLNSHSIENKSLNITKLDGLDLNITDLDSTDLDSTDLDNTLLDSPNLNGTGLDSDKVQNNIHSPNNIQVHNNTHAQNIAYMQNSSHELYINIDATAGIGRVTMPGLAVPVGFAAINPVPRLQIACGLYQIAAQHKFSGYIEVRLSVPNGQKMAKRTLNSRLGILGGISILGTQGIVKPYSHAAWKDTIVKCLDMASVINKEQICFCTGRRSERLIMQKYPLLADQSFVQSADFVGFSLEEAHKRQFTKIVWACFFGKFVKLAEGHFYTHARSSELNMEFIVKYCIKHGATCTKAVATCLTAAHALELLLDDAVGMDILNDIAQKAAYNAQVFAKQRVHIHLFHMQGHEILSI